MGANSYIWKIRHIRLHHNYPNVMGWDSDIEQSDIARIFPHGSYSKMHKYQHIYLPLLYPFYLINWLLIRDFKDFFNKKIIWKVTTISTVEYIKLFLFKVSFFLHDCFTGALFKSEFCNGLHRFSCYDVYGKHYIAARTINAARQFGK